MMTEQLSTEHFFISAQMRGRLLFSLLLLMVGTGNILFGMIKLEDYSRIITELPSPEGSVTDGLPTDLHLLETEGSARTSFQRKVQNRLELYKIVVIGGRILLGAGLALFSYCAITLLFRSCRQGAQETYPDPPKP